MKKITKTPAEWQAVLTPESYYVTRKKGTEKPFTGKYNQFDKSGHYQCICCSQTLFSSADKFNSACGWPGFNKPVSEQAVTYLTDNSFNMHRTEVLCSQCDAHLGHVFDDNPTPDRLRYCINSVALDFCTDE